MATPLDNLVACFGLSEASGNPVELTEQGLVSLTQQGTVPGQTGKISGARGPFSTANYFSTNSVSNWALANQSCAWSAWLHLHDLPAGYLVTLPSRYTIYAAGAASINFSPSGSTFVEVDDGVPLNEWFWMFVWLDQVNKQLGIRINDRDPYLRTFTGNPNQTASGTLYVGGPDEDTDLHMEQFCFWKGRIPNVYEQNGIYNAGAGTLFENFGNISDEPPPEPAPTSRLRMSQRLLAPRRF